MRFRHVFAPFLILVVLGACSSSDPDEGVVASTTVAVTQTSTPQTSTTQGSTTAAMVVASEVTTTTDEPAITIGPVGDAASDSYIATTWGSAGPFYDNGGSEPDGDGCSPGSDDLPDGIWYVRLVSLDDVTLGVDLMCVYSDEAAFSRDDYVGGDRMYVNESAKVRYVELGENPAFYFLTDFAMPDSQEYVPLTVVANAIVDGPADGWLLVEGGHATEFWQPWDS